MIFVCVLAPKVAETVAAVAGGATDYHARTDTVHSLIQCDICQN